MYHLLKPGKCLCTARYTEYSIISPGVLGGGSHEKCAPLVDFDILIAEGASG